MDGNVGERGLTYIMADDLYEQPHGRRAMFRLGLKRLVDPLADYLQERLDVSIPVSRSILRPPGALSESEFLEICYRCGNCVDVCPARAIHSMASDDIQLSGTPSIDPDVTPCTVCDELACMKACPSGALMLVESASEIRMGTAKLQQRACVRIHGETCTICVDRCPIGSAAIKVGESGEIEINEDGCIGCGVCQHYCPAMPKAIVVEPV